METAMLPAEHTEEFLKDHLRPVTDPELNLSLIELGLIYGITKPEPSKVHVKMTLTSPACPAGDIMVQDIKTKFLEIEGIKDVEVEIVWEPKWDPKIMASEECKEVLGIW